MLDISTLTPAERRIYLAGVQNGLKYSRLHPTDVPKALEIADLELQLTY